MEYFHAMFGGNNWHTGSGASRHTFPFPIGSWSISAQSGSGSNTPCAWDRFHLGWHVWKDDNLTVRKDSLVSAQDAGGNEIPSGRGRTIMRSKKRPMLFSRLIQQ